MAGDARAPPDHAHLGHDLEPPPPYDEAPYDETAAALCDQAVVSGMERSVCALLKSQS